MTQRLWIVSILMFLLMAGCATEPDRPAAPFSGQFRAVEMSGPAADTTRYIVLDLDAAGTYKLKIEGDPLRQSDVVDSIGTYRLDGNRIVLSDEALANLELRTRGAAVLLRTASLEAMLRRESPDGP